MCRGRGTTFACVRADLIFLVSKQVNQMTINDDHLEVAERILRYLREHPEAKDTVEGIAEWWLAEDKITHAVDQVSEAVAWLVEKGHLMERQVAGGKTIYEINTKRCDQTARLNQ